MVYEERVPAALKDEEQWVCWRTESRDEKPTKVPVDPVSGGYARVNHPGTWAGFDAALASYRERDGLDGVGFVFRETGPYAGVDLDECVHPASGEVEAWARDIVDRLDSYTEWSPSGTGLHVIVEGAVPDGGNRRGGVEMYDGHRYFTVTGDHMKGTPQTVQDRAGVLRAVHREHVGGREQTAEDAGERSAVELPDADLIERAMGAANGDKFAALWGGDTSGYPSHSEADQALCTMLAFWTGGDPGRVEELFGRSGLVRDKWRNRPDYRERTIERAIETCTEFYEHAEEDA